MIRFPVLCLLIFTLAVLSAGAPIPGLPATVADGKAVAIKIQELPPTTGALDINGKAAVAVAQAFMKRYPNVTLQPFSFLKMPIGTGVGEAGSDIMMAMAGGVAPDVMTVNFRASETYISQGFLYPLDHFVDNWRAAPGGADEIDRVIPKPELWDVIRRPGPDGQTHIWCIPPSLYLGAMLFRKDILRNAGLNPDTPPQSWDELFRQSLQATDPRKGVYGFYLHHSWALTSFIRSAGGDVLKRRPETNEWYAAYTDDASVTAAAFCWKLQQQPWGICPHDDSHFTLDPATLTGTCPHGHAWTKALLDKQKLFFRGVCAPDITYWGQGKQAFFLDYIGDMQLNNGLLDPNLIGYAPIPRGPDGLRKSELNAHMLGINGTITNPAKLEAAWAFVRFATSEEARRITTRVLVEGGYAKFVNPLWLKRFGYDKYLHESPPGWAETYQAAIDSAHPEPYGKNAQQIYIEMDQAWDQIKLMERPDHAVFARLLHENAVRTNERLIGKLPPEEKTRRDRVALVVVIGCALLFGLLIRYTLATYGKALQGEVKRSRFDPRRFTWAALLLAPALIGVLLFQYVPLVRGSTIAFQDYALLGAKPYVGVSNFGAVLFAPEFWAALGRSAIYAAISLSIGFFLPVLLALLLHEIPIGSLFYRIIYFLPAVTSGIVIMLLWKQLYDPSTYGMLNHLFSLLHLPQQTFLQDPKLAIVWVLLPGIWAHVGPGCIIYLAAMKQVPEEYYEAADVDGAGFLTKFRGITLPFLKPLLIINFIGACIGAFKSFEPVWIMTNGGPVKSTSVLGLEIFKNSFIYLKYGYATAMGWILASLLIGFTIFQLRYLSKVQFKLAKSDE